MKITSAITYRIFDTAPLASLAEFEAGLKAAEFVRCSPTQEKSFGFVPPREKNGAMVESIGGQWFMRAMVETKTVPAAIVREHIEGRCEQIEESTGRKPGRKERKDLKEDVIHALLPMAFPKKRALNLWLDPKAMTLTLDTTSYSRADDVITVLVRNVPNFVASQITTVLQPYKAMADWLVNDPPPGFSIDRECKLESTDESKSMVRYAKHALDIDEIREHVKHGKVPKALAMTWDDRVSFMLDDSMRLSGIKFLEAKVDLEGGRNAADDFDADAAIVSGELSCVLVALHEALGGHAQALITDGAEPADSADSEGSAPPWHDGEGPDPLYDAAVALVRKEMKTSISLVQRHLRIGYNRAARLMESMESAGAVSAMDGQGKREVLP